MTRGFSWRGSGIRWQPAAFVLAGAAIHVLTHIHRLGLGPAERLMLFVFGLACATAVVRFDSLWPRTSG